MASGYNYSILVGVDLDTSTIDKQLQSRNYRFDVGVTGTQDVQHLTQATEDLSLSYQVANRIFNETVQVISSMVDQVYELDSAMVEYRKVSDLSGKALDDYVGKLSDMRTAVARTTSEMVEAATSFRKSGFNDEDSAQLAQVAAMLQNIADEELSAGTAADFLVSQIQAFNLEATDAQHIIDAVNEVSNNFAVSSADLTKSLPLVSAALSVGNNEFEEMIGLVTGAVEITRNASKAARGLVSVQSRLNQVVDETSSTGQKLLAFYEQHKIDVYDSEGQLRSLYDILSDVSKQWDTLSTNEKDYYLNIQAGELAPLQGELREVA